VHYNDPFLECPGEDAFTRELNAQDLSPDDYETQMGQFLLDCRDHLLAQDVDLARYNSVTNAHDLEDLRIALGYEQINIYGTSYGTRLGLTAMRYHPEGIRSAIIDSVFPPHADYPSELVPSVTGAITRVFEDCAADPDCSARYPDLESNFYQVIDDLQAEPISISVDAGTPIIVDNEVFLDAIYMALHYADEIPYIPRAIDAASRGEIVDPIRSSVSTIMSYGQYVATGVYWSSFCLDEITFDTLENAQAVADDYPPQMAYFVGSSYFALCPLWTTGTADPIENEPVVSDIPTLVFAGRYDPITPPAWGQRAAEHLSNSHYYEFPNMGHGVMRSDDCGLSIGLQFLDNPTVEPDASCMESLTIPHFE
jgi:pimeloyl-ACP methyl ester carboxylesterase